MKTLFAILINALFSFTAWHYVAGAQNASSFVSSWNQLAEDVTCHVKIENGNLKKVTGERSVKKALSLRREPFFLEMASQYQHPILGTTAVLSLQRLNSTRTTHTAVRVLANTERPASQNLLPIYEYLEKEFQSNNRACYDSLSEVASSGNASIEGLSGLANLTKKDLLRDLYDEESFKWTATARAVFANTLLSKNGGTESLQTRKFPEDSKIYKDMQLFREIPGLPRAIFLLHAQGVGGNDVRKLVISIANEEDVGPILFGLVIRRWQDDLTSALLEVIGDSEKADIFKRIVLEGKRLKKNEGSSIRKSREPN